MHCNANATFYITDYVGKCLRIEKHLIDVLLQGSQTVNSIMEKVFVSSLTELQN